MSKGKIAVVGLGPGRPGLITRESWERIEKAERLALRTEIHPTVEFLRERGISFESYDGFYESAESFEALYRSIAEDLLARAERGEDLVYAVPGSPFVAERTVALLRELACSREVELRILPGMSFVEAMYEAIGIDPVNGLAILDGEDMEALPEGMGMPLVVTQIYAQRIASDVKLMLMERYPDAYEVIYLHHLALPDASVRRIPLYELDRQPDIDHLTCLFVPGKGK